MRVGRDEVDGRVEHAQLGHRPGDGQPPAGGHARVAEVAAADQPQTDVAFVFLHELQRRVEALAPGLMQALPVILAGAGGLARRLLGEVHALQRLVQLVPLDLIGDQRRHEVVNVGHGRDEHRERASVLVPAPAPGWSLQRLPLHDVRAEDCLEALRALAHHHVPAVLDGPRQPARRVEERTHVALRLARKRVQHRAHADVRLHQRVDLDLARALQHRRVRAHVELDGVLAASPAGVGGRFHLPTIEITPRPVIYRSFTSA